MIKSCRAGVSTVLFVFHDMTSKPYGVLAAVIPDISLITSKYRRCFKNRGEMSEKKGDGGIKL